MAFRTRKRPMDSFDYLVIVARIALFFALIATFYFALSSGNSGISFIPWDKALHYCCFIVLTGLSVTAFPRVNLIIIAAIIAGMGWSIEELQGLPYFHRDKDFWDWVAEVLAITTVYCAMFASFIRQNISKNRKY